MPAENFYIALADVNSQTIDFPYMVDENGINARPLQMGEGLTGYVLRTGKALLAGPHNAEDLKNGVCVVMEGTERGHCYQLRKFQGTGLAGSSPHRSRSNIRSHCGAGLS